MLFPRTWAVLFLWCALAVGAHAAEATIIKVLPHFIDLDGRKALSPSLYERDAYQAILRQHPEKRSGLRFDIHWKAKRVKAASLKLRMELRGSAGGQTTPLVLEESVKPSRWWSGWTALTLNGARYQELGDLTAWRATLWQGEKQVAELHSFLW